MAKRHSPKLILDVCQLSFSGMSDDDLSVKFGINKSTISGWRKLTLWKEFEAELIDAHKQQIMEIALQQQADAQG